MVSTQQIHEKFSSYWPNDYTKKDLQTVCRVILQEMGRPTRNALDTVKKEWGQVCSFLIEWNGTEKEELQKSEPAAKFKITPLQKRMFRGEICPYCKKETEYIDSSEVWGKSYGMIYICRPCQSWCGTHKGTNISLGRLANAELREWKKEAHRYFDQIWKSNLKTREGAYLWMAMQLNIPRKYCHIGMLNLENCKKLVELCQKELK